MHEKARKLKLEEYSTLASFDVTSLFTKVLTTEALEVIENHSLWSLLKDYYICVSHLHTLWGIVLHIRILYGEWCFTSANFMVNGDTVSTLGYTKKDIKLVLHLSNIGSSLCPAEQMCLSNIELVLPLRL